MSVLLIYEEIPASTKLYIINDPIEIKVALKCHGNYGNSSGLTEEQEANLEYLTNDILPKHNPLFDSEKSGDNIIEVRGITTIVVTGFLL